MLNNLPRVILGLGAIIPWMFIYIWRTEDFRDWTAIGIGLGQFVCLVLLLAWDDIWYVNYIKKRRL